MSQPHNGVLHHSAHFVAVLSRDGIILDINRAALAFTGLRREAVVGQPVWAVSAETAARDRLRRAVGLAGSGQSTTLVERIRLHNGMDATIEVTVLLAGDADDAAALILLEGRDVTDEIRSRRELEDSLAKFAGIVNISADAIISVDEEYRITDFNHGAERIFGYTETEVVGRSLDMLIPARFRGSHVGHMRVFGRSPVPARRMGERREISALRSDNREFPADASISKQDVDGRRVYTVVLRDITAQKRAESSQRFLARAGALLASSLDVTTTLDSVARLAADFVADCCVIFDATDSGVIRRAAVAASDPAMQQLLERSRDESLVPGSRHPARQVVDTGEPVLLSDASLFLAAAGPDPDLELMRALDTRTAMFVPLVARGRISGTIAFYGCSADRTFDADDLALAHELALGSALAVDNARLYEATRRAVRARDEILAVVSHDLGNPLAAIRISTSLLMRDADGSRHPDGELAHLRGIRKSAEQMERLIRDLLDVERIAAGPIALGSKPVRPVTLISAVIEMFNVIAAGKSIALRSRVPATLPSVRADRDRIVQALSNLVGNAIKFTQPGGSVEILAQVMDEEVMISVCDDGPGIDAEHLEHVFDRFWRSGQRDRRGEGGLGLGLAIVKGIVDAHGGRVWAESTHGQGTTIRFTLPLAAAS